MARASCAEEHRCRNGGFCLLQAFFWAAKFYTLPSEVKRHGERWGGGEREREERGRKRKSGRKRKRKRFGSLCCRVMSFLFGNVVLGGKRLNGVVVVVVVAVVAVVAVVVVV